MVHSLRELDAIRDDPRTRGAVEHVREIAGEHPAADVALAACRALLAIADLRPFDEPRAVPSPEQLVVDIAAEHPANAAILRAKGSALGLLRRDDEALTAFEAALAIVPGDLATLFDLSLFAKRRARWTECLEASQRALRESARGDAGALAIGAGSLARPLTFHVAIAATALGKGAIAVDAYRALGLAVEANRAGMPVLDPLPHAFVRVPARGAGVGSDDRKLVPDRASTFERLRVAPIAPCHGVVETATFLDAPVDYGDVVLWDAAPIELVQDTDGNVAPLFAVLACLHPGTERRFRFAALEQRAGDVAALEAELPEGCRVFVQREQVEHVCPRCATGDVLRKHEHTRDLVRVVYGKIVAPETAPLTELRDTLERFVRIHGRVSLSVPQLYEALGDTKRAGTEHQAFLGVERAAARASGGGA